MTIRSHSVAARAPRHTESVPVVEDYVGLANALARRFAGRGEDIDDLIQVAMVGLVSARNRFNPELGTSFTTFATSTILGELKHHFRDGRWLVHMPRGKQERFLHVRDCLDQLTQSLGRSPTVPELAAATGLTGEQVLEAQEVAATFSPARLDDGPGEDGSEAAGRLRDTLGGVDERFDLIEQRVVIAPLLAHLSERDRLILRLRFGAGLTQSEIAQHIGVSQMQVSRLLHAAISRLNRLIGD